MFIQQKNRQVAALSTLITASFLLSGCGPRGLRGPQQMGPPEVSVVDMKTERVVLTTELPGRTAAYRRAEIRPQVNGLILNRAFKEGSEIKAGGLLYQIDPAPYQAIYDQAKASVAMTEANLPATRSREERFKKLVESHAVGQQDYDDALAALRRMEAQLGVSKAAMESARINLSYTPIKAPISGRIGRSRVTEGALVTAYQPVPLATIQQLDPIYVDIPKSTVEMMRLRRRLTAGHLRHDGESQGTVQIIQEDGTPYSLEGTLAFRDITVEPSTGSVILRVVVPNPDGMLLPGMFVRAILKEGVNDAAILVPQQCVSRNRKGMPFVMVVGDDGTVAMKMLTLDRSVGDKWLVSSGLNPGDQVIIEGLQRVRPGTPVKVVPLDSKPDDSPAENTH